MIVKTPKIKKRYKFLYFLLVFVLTLTSTFGIIVNVGEQRLKNNLIVGSDDASPEYDNDDADIYVDGKSLYYNKDLINILFMGIDKANTAGTGQGQADALFLVSLDTAGKLINIFVISRNAVTEIDLFNASGEKFGTEKKQICLAYAYGNNDKQSAENCVNSVSKLFYGIPINAYYALRMNFISQITDAVGGVDVTLAEDVIKEFPNNRVGDRLTLLGDNVLPYLRARGESNGPRSARHKTFIQSFIKSAKSALIKDISLPVKVYDSLSKNANSSINPSSITYLATKCLNADFKIHNVEGEYGFDGKYETFDVDEEKLYDLVIKSFYTEKQ